MSFDLMRLVAALLVVVSHSFPLAGHPALRIRGVEDLGALGVSIFFVISGYLVSASYRRDPKAYIWKRILRIEPGLLASLLVTVAILAAFTSASQTDYWRAAAAYVGGNATLYLATTHLPGLFQHTVNPEIVNGVLWTLRLEFSFYLLILLVRGRAAWTAALAVLGLAVWAGLAFGAPGWADERPTRVAFLIARNGWLFFAGAALQLYGARVPLWLGGVSALAFPFVGPIALPTAVVGLSRPGKLPADLSYGIYIYAFPVQQMLAEFGQLNVLTAILAVLPFAALSWFCVEKPALALKPGRGVRAEA